MSKNPNKDAVNVSKSFISANPHNNEFDHNDPIKEVDESREITTSSNVFERLTIEAKILPEKRKGREHAELERSKVDEKTGQPLFHPVTGRSV